MRASLPLALMIATLLAACASDKDALASKHISQQGALKVHPGLLGETVPPSAAGNAQPAPVAPPAVEVAPAETPPAQQGETVAPAGGDAS